VGNCSFDSLAEKIISDEVDFFSKQNTAKITPFLDPKFNQAGNTLLHLAVTFERSSIVKFLLGQGADREAKNSEDITAEDIARSLTDPKIKYLFQSVPKVTLTPSMITYSQLSYEHCRWSPLHEAVQNEDNIAIANIEVNAIVLDSQDGRMSYKDRELKQVLDQYHHDLNEFNEFKNSFWKNYFFGSSRVSEFLIILLGNKLATLSDNSPTYIFLVHMLEEALALVLSKCNIRSLEADNKNAIITTLEASKVSSLIKKLLGSIAKNHCKYGKDLNLNIVNIKKALQIIYEKTSCNAEKTLPKPSNALTFSRQLEPSRSSTDAMNNNSGNSNADETSSQTKCNTRTANPQTKLSP
jgi:hypothetical protein